MFLVLVRIAFRPLLGGTRTSSTNSLAGNGLTQQFRLLAMVYDILPPTTAITDYAIGLEKLSAKSFFRWR